MIGMGMRLQYPLHRQLLAAYEFDDAIRRRSGLDWQRDDPSWSRSLLKLFGLLITLGGVAMLYWLFPHYQQPRFAPYYALLQQLLPVWLVLALPYFYFVDRRMRTPHDGYWLLGHWAYSILKRGKHTPLDRAERQLLGQHWLSWLIKGFFLPLMFIYFCNYLQTPTIVLPPHRCSSGLSCFAIWHS